MLNWLLCQYFDEQLNCIEIGETTVSAADGVALLVSFSTLLLELTPWD